ncbi:hypothetical protein GDO78_003286 [Eleutherodactylus coqui]|uniref:Uncharacterized protein n=1 Tax=Eleutherodactylus coqui TaxID=57060 RepID=A0A8J6K0A1_ELECQ|nr:hypothetical protein GDO78_003286 [Eleutherodactylus coqui]
MSLCEVTWYHEVVSVLTSHMVFFQGAELDQSWSGEGYSTTSSDKTGLSQCNRKGEWGLITPETNGKQKTLEPCPVPAPRIIYLLSSCSHTLVAALESRPPSNAALISLVYTTDTQKAAYPHISGPTDHLW